MIMRIDSFYLAGLRWPQVCCSSVAATPRLTRTDIVLQAARTAARELLVQHHSTLGSICGDSSLDHWVQLPGVNYVGGRVDSCQMLPI